MDFRKIAITISPPVRKERINFLYANDKYDIAKELNKCSSYYIIYPELSLDSRLHYHGIVKIKDWTKWHKSVRYALSQLLGFIKIDPLKTHRDNMAWAVYMSKSWGLMRDILKIDQPLIFKNLRRKPRICVDVHNNCIFDYMPLDVK